MLLVCLCWLSGGNHLSGGCWTSCFALLSSSSPLFSSEPQLNCTFLLSNKTERKTRGESKSHDKRKWKDCTIFRREETNVFRISCRATRVRWEFINNTDYVYFLYFFIQRVASYCSIKVECVLFVVVEQTHFSKVNSYYSISFHFICQKSCTSMKTHHILEADHMLVIQLFCKAFSN